MDFAKLILHSKISGEESLVILNLTNWWKVLRWFVYVLEKNKKISMTIPNSSCSITEKKERNPQLRQSQFTCFLSGWIICYIRKIKHFRDKNIFNSIIISEQWPNLKKNKRFSIEESEEFRIKIIWQGGYIKYKTLESFSINKHHTTTSYKIFCGKQSSSADSYVTYLDPITMLRNIEGKKTTIFKLEYLLLRLI